MADRSTTSSRVPIPRGGRARERVLRAALEVLADRDLPGLTMEAIALRAGASKATVYRHWRSPGEVLVDALDLSFQPFVAPATGQPRTDLMELFATLEALLSGQPFPQLMAAFIDAAERDPGLQGLHARLTERRRKIVRQVLDRARRRGEIPSDADVELAVDQLSGPAFYHKAGRGIILLRPLDRGTPRRTNQLHAGRLRRRGVDQEIRREEEPRLADPRRAARGSRRSHRDLDADLRLTHRSSKRYSIDKDRNDVESIWG